MNDSAAPIPGLDPTGLAPGPDWRHFAHTYWAREPVVVPGAGALGLGPAETHALLRAATAAAPPERVRLATTDGRLKDPGPLLPGPADPDLAGYADRLAGHPRLAGDGWLLTVTDPLSHDFALWSRVRDVLADLWRHIGRAPLPVTADLAVGDRHHTVEDEAVRPDAAALTWVLDGELTVRVRPEHTGTEYELRARAGDVVHWPAGSTHLDHRPGRCTTLRLTVPARTTSALPLVADVLADLMRRHPAYVEGPITYPHPMPADPDGRLTAPPRLTASADLFTDTLAGPEPERELLLRWAALRSAAGLDPAPPRRPGIRLTPEHRLRRVAEIVRAPGDPDSHGPAVWAANGHAWTAPGAAADRLLARLRTTHDARSVAELAQSADTSADDPELLPLLSELYRSRAVEATGPERRR
ncbi:hypothetical protein GTY65_04640 [Streptomyces sp. SID8379]|uniref:hypothetical protein n=1 Tax=unclassified Streptomyces TaxID=2593676 RepID=UPI000367C70A|nr:MULTISPECIES: hypothetical protein [unclassified Streptomyces]MYW63367.1 hypothetical protein [Streptomyces sp. SID8379]